MKKIPIVDLKAQYRQIKKDIDLAIKSVIKDSSFIGGQGNPYVKKFEDEFAKYIGTRNCIGCANGTDAIEIALKTLGIGPGDEVIVPALSWFSTSEAVSNVGASPVFVDILPKRYTIDPNKLEKVINKKTKAIIPVHLYGLPADMDEIMKISQKHNLIVIEDCAQAHGAEYKGRKVGTFGLLATFSFFPSKNLGAYGDAGCITTNDDNLAKISRMIGNHGQVKKHEHKIEGRNSRLDGIQAAILSVKLSHIDEWNKQRINKAALYNKLLFKNNNVVLPEAPSYSKHVYHIFGIQIENRDKIQNKLKENDIESSIHYPIALPFLDLYKKIGFEKKDFPVAEKIVKKIISIPIYPELKKDQIKFICDILNDNL